MSSIDASPHVIFEVIDGPHAGERWEFDRHDTLLAGRGSAAQVRLTRDPHFSRHHFLLEVNPPNVLIRDLGSRNGTLVNGQKISQCRLKPGDIIAGGQTRMRITLFDAEDLIGTADLAESPAAKATAAPPSASPSRAVQPSTEASPKLPAANAPLLDIPGYEIASKLGQGGMGVVYLARDRATQEPVAVKIVVPESTANDRAMNFFLREARVLSKLNHKHIVRFRQMGLHLGQAFFVMDYVEAIPWKKLVADLPAAQRNRAGCAVICQVLEGLHYAHELGIVHRDLKPANILVQIADRELHGKERGPATLAPSAVVGPPPVLAKLADFGLAKNYENAGLSGMTHEGQTLGTIPFMAPEQIISARDARPAVDIYSAGATLYNLLSGAYAYDFRPGSEPLLIVLEEPIVPLDQRCPDAPPGLAAVIERALAKKAKDRFPTAAALRQALLPFAEGRTAGGT